MQVWPILSFLAGLAQIAGMAALHARSVNAFKNSRRSGIDFTSGLNYRILNSTPNRILSVHLGAEGEIHAAAKALGLFNVATLGAGLGLNAGGSIDIHFGGPIGIYYEDGHMTFRFNQTLEAHLRLFFSLIATIRASLLGFHWTKAWPIFDKDIGMSWAVNAPLGVQYDNDANVTMPLSEGALSAISFLQQLFADAPNDFESLVPDAPPAGPPSGPPAGPPSGPQGPSGPAGPTAPRGRTDQDPIPMVWYKSPGMYPISITLSGERFFFTEPEFIHVPDGPDLADVRRDAIDGQIRIGVSPGSRFYPEVLGPPWPRVWAGVIRTGRKQANFRRLLEAHGFNWGSFEADHVRDLQWAGQDDYANLWPLERSHNNAANQVLNQLVTYLDGAGNVVTVPLRDTPLNRYFLITRYA